MGKYSAYNGLQLAPILITRASKHDLVKELTSVCVGFDSTPEVLGIIKQHGRIRSG
jgi:hypothetical protein